MENNEGNDPRLKEKELLTSYVYNACSMCERGFSSERGRPSVRRGPWATSQGLGEDPGCVLRALLGKELSVPKHLCALLTELFFGCRFSHLGEGVPRLSAVVPPCHPSCPPAVYPLNHKLFCEIPCPVHNGDGAVSSAPSLAL